MRALLLYEKKAVIPNDKRVSFAGVVLLNVSVRLATKSYSNSPNTVILTVHRRHIWWLPRKAQFNIHPISVFYLSQQQPKRM